LVELAVHDSAITGSVAVQATTERIDGAATGKRPHPAEAGRSDYKVSAFGVLCFASDFNERISSETRNSRAADRKQQGQLFQ